MATNVCISMACVFTIPTTLFIATPSGVVYVVLAPGVSPLVRPPIPSILSSFLDQSDAMFILELQRRNTEVQM